MYYNLILFLIDVGFLTLFPNLKLPNLKLENNIFVEFSITNCMFPCFLFICYMKKYFFSSKYVEKKIIQSLALLIDYWTLMLFVNFIHNLTDRTNNDEDRFLKVINRKTITL